MFSATDRTGTSMKCWWTMLTPRSMASCGLAISTGSPNRRISPASGIARPYRMFMRVVLPAPFSPSRAWISPARTSRSMPSLAVTPGYRFVMPRISSGSGAALAGATLGGPLSDCSVALVVSSVIQSPNVRECVSGPIRGSARSLGVGRNGLRATRFRGPLHRRSTGPRAGMDPRPRSPCRRRRRRSQPGCPP